MKPGRGFSPSLASIPRNGNPQEPSLLSCQCCSGRCWPPVRSRCERLANGKPFLSLSCRCSLSSRRPEPTLHARGALLGNFHHIRDPTKKGDTNVPPFIRFAKASSAEAALHDAECVRSGCQGLLSAAAAGGRPCQRAAAVCNSSVIRRTAARRFSRTSPSCRFRRKLSP